MPTARKTVMGIAFVIALVVTLHALGILAFIERPARSLIGFPSGVLYRATRLKTIAGESTEATAAKEIMEEAHVALLREENASLRRQLDFLEKTPYTTIGADVIGQDVEPIGNTLIVNRGSLHGVLAGQPVITDSGILVGKIVRADEESAIVRLLHDGQSKIAATVLNMDRSVGLVEGGYGLSVRMNFIPQNEAIAPGDLIVTSGLEAGIPRGLVIGRVEAVEKEAYQPFQRAILSTSAKLDRLLVVSIIVGA